MHIVRKFKRLIRSNSGLSTLEFAIAIPILMILLIGSVEISRYIIIVQKIDKAAYTIADLVTQTAPYDAANSDTLTRTNVQMYLGFLSELMGSHWDASRGIASVISFSQGSTLSDPPTINWSETGGGAFSGGAISDITGASITSTSDGDSISLSTDLQNAVNAAGGFIDGENVIAVEVFYNYEPIFSSGYVSLAASTLKRSAFFAPRYGVLDTIGP